MKNLIRLSFLYALFAIICGVFYREFTKYKSFSGKTTLSVTHVHLFVLGMILFMILALFSIHTNLLEHKKFKLFMILYNIGLPFMVIMMFIRGVLQVLEIELSKGSNAAISGIAGISHIIMTASFIVLYLILKQVHIKEYRK